MAYESKCRNTPEATCASEQAKTAISQGKVLETEASKPDRQFDVKIGQNRKTFR
jgi:hypothetical protein